MIVLVPTVFEWFEEWQEELKGKRGIDYERLKNSFVEASMSVVLKLFPQLEGKVGSRAIGGGAGRPFPEDGNKAPGKDREPIQGADEGLTSPHSCPSASSGGECDRRVPTDQPVLSGCSPRCHLRG